MYKLSKQILEKHPRWHNLLPIPARYTFQNFWKGFKQIKLAEIWFIIRCITLIRRRAEAYAQKC